MTAEPRLITGAELLAAVLGPPQPVERHPLPGGLVALYVPRPFDGTATPRRPCRLVDHGHPSTGRDDTAPPRGEIPAPVTRVA